ncbi:hypothetical protein [Neolewinella sp.]|uniref:hypothetical protein n=1 Tax=Neolewinella sp. TaxID=2993543 RepID=UPI003B51D8B3
MSHYPVSFLLFIMSGYLSAQQIVTPTFDTITVDFDVWDTPYLLHSELLDTAGQDLETYMIGNYLSFSGYAREATQVMEEEFGEASMDTLRYTRFREEFHAIPAIPSLLEDAEQYEIAIINEAHHEPRHRVFTRQLLQGLYDRGYRHFGMETLSQDAGTDSLADQASYPSLISGYYTRDPQFAAMVAEAQRIGYRIFGYEAPGTGSPKLRELGQTKNIVNYRTAHPDGKLLLHVGYSHALEGELGGEWEKAMAQRLADTTGLDPLTIDQTAFREMSDTVQERYEYRQLLALGYLCGWGTAGGYDHGGARFLLPNGLFEGLLVRPHRVPPTNHLSLRTTGLRICLRPARRYGSFRPHRYRRSLASAGLCPG